MSQISVNDITSLDGKSGPVISGITTVSSTGYMMIPAGPTEYRGGRGRGVIAGGITFPSPNTTFNIIDYITISSAGNALDFGDLTVARYNVGGCASSVRGLYFGGQDSAPDGQSNVIDYITISSTGNAFDFGDLLVSKRRFTGVLSNNTRGIAGGGGGDSPGTVSTIQAVEISTLGNSFFFGDLLQPADNIAACASPTRGIFAGGSPGPINIISFVTISTLGDAQDFGDLTEKRQQVNGCSNSVRGIFAGGRTDVPTPGAATNVIDYITIASLGDAIDFGDLTFSRNQTAPVSSSIRGIFAGGFAPTSPVLTIYDVIDFVSFSTLGNASDFGDLTQSRMGPAGCSDAHGGLG